MTFDIKKFNAATFEPNTIKVPVPELGEFFQGDPEWEVRGLTGLEIAQVEQAADINSNIGALLTALMGDSKEKAAGVKEVMGIMEGAPSLYIKSLEKVIRGSKVAGGNMENIDKPIIVKMATYRAPVFFRLVTEIDALSNKGYLTAGKLVASTETP